MSYWIRRQTFLVEFIFTAIMTFKNKYFIYAPVTPLVSRVYILMVSNQVTRLLVCPYSIKEKYI